MTTISFIEDKNALVKEEVINLGIMPVRDDVIIPEVSEGNAGIDLRVITENKQPVTIEPNGTYCFRTGIKMNIPKGYYIEIVPRSSTGIKKNLSLLNTVGILDSSWKGETLLFTRNNGSEPITVLNNERLFQMIIHKVHKVKISKVDNVGISDRGENGFGSTGRM